MCWKKETADTASAKQEQPEASTKQRVLTVVGIALCAILIPILILNCTLIIKSLVNKDEVPGIGGKMPLIVLTDSMYPEIKAGDLIICEEVDANEIKVGDVISFFDPAGKGTTVVTHRVTGITEKDGELYFRTKGDNNNTEDRLSVPEENLVGRWTETRFAGLGRVAMFMQSTAGLIVCIGVPLAALVAYELLRYKKANKQKQGDVDALMAELAALKAKQAAQEESKDEQGE